MTTAFDFNLANRDLLFWFDPDKSVWTCDPSFRSITNQKTRFRWSDPLPPPFTVSRWSVMSSLPSGPDNTSTGTGPTLPDTTGRVVFVYRVNVVITLASAGNLTFTGGQLRTVGPHHSFIDHTDLVWTSAVTTFPTGNRFVVGNEIWSLQPLDTTGSAVTFLRRETLNRPLPTP